MHTSDYREALNAVPDDVVPVVLALSVLMDRIKGLPQADRDELFDLVMEWKKTNDPADVASIRAAILEILGQRPMTADCLPLPSAPTPGLRKWTMSVGGVIRQHRQELGLTQAGLAAKAGIPQSHLSRLETGEYSGTHKTLSKIAAALGIDVSKLDPSGD